MAIDQDKLNEFLGRFVGDLGATMAAGNIVVGHRLGLYRALAAGPATPEELAARTESDPRYITEWLRGQAAGGYVTYQPETGTYGLSEEQAFALADPTGAVYAPGAFVLALGALHAESQITESFRTGAGMGWHEHHDDVFLGCELFVQPRSPSAGRAHARPTSRATRTTAATTCPQPPASRRTAPKGIR